MRLKVRDPAWDGAEGLEYLHYGWTLFTHLQKQWHYPPFPLPYSFWLATMDNPKNYRGVESEEAQRVGQIIYFLPMDCEAPGKRGMEKGKEILSCFIHLILLA